MLYFSAFITASFQKSPGNNVPRTILKNLRPLLNALNIYQLQKNYYRLLDRLGIQAHYRKGTKVMVIESFDGNLFCSVNDKDVYALESIPVREQKSKALDLDYTTPKPRKRYIPPMKHPWRQVAFRKFVRQQEHHLFDESVV